MEKVSKKNIYVRLECNSEVGYGHLFRSLALLRHLSREKYYIFLVVSDSSYGYEEAISNHGIELIKLSNSKYDLEDAIIFDNLVSYYGLPSLIILDSYLFSTEWEQYTYKKYRNLLIIDDFARPRCCRYYLNPSIEDFGSDFKYKNNQINFLGPQYALVDQSYFGLRSAAKIRSSLNKIFVCFGGSDFTNETEKFLKSYIKSDIKVDMLVVLGPGYSHKEHINQLVANSSKGMHISLVENIDNLAPLMLSSDLSIGSFGSMCYERSTLKLPSINLITSDDQISNSNIYKKYNADINVGYSNPYSGDEIMEALLEVIKNKYCLAEMSYHTSLITDGDGANRVLRGIREI